LAVKRPGKRRSSSFPPPAKSARLAFRGTSALNLNMFPLAGNPAGDAPADEEEEHAAADEARRSGVSGPKSAARRSVQ
jgi:hypothetical protein